jgi:two-component system NtrC family sensor kinase
MKPKPKPKPQEPELDAVKEKLERAEAALVQSEKMASLGNLVAGVAHEINTPVGSIHANSDLMVRALEKLREILDDAPELTGQKELTRILDTLENVGHVNQTACQRIVAIVRSLKSFARLEEPECRTVDLHEEIESALTLVHHELKNRIEVERDFGEIPPVECFPNHLNQVFLNLLVNAGQAIDDKGSIRISTRAEDDHVRITFQDSGSGIRPEHLDKIFEPGFTTKDVGHGTGLGLSICYKIIHAHHGDITVESEVGKGTTFTITLPVHASPATEA